MAKNCTSYNAISDLTYLRRRRRGQRLVNIDYFIESATYGFLFTSCKTLENERVAALTRSFSKVLQRVNKNPYKALSML